MPGEPTEPHARGTLGRVAARVYTGPLGHLYSATADICVFAARALAERYRSAGSTRRRNSDR